MNISVTSVFENSLHTHTQSVHQPFFIGCRKTKEEAREQDQESFKMRLV